MKRIIILLAVLASAVLGLGAVAAAPASAATPCTAQVGGACGGYGWAGWPGSNGFNTYVQDQGVGPAPGSTGSITVTDPSNWSATASYGDCGGCVQTFTAVQQLTNNWGTGGFNGSSNMPLPALSKLQVVYSETSPSADAGNQYEFAPDLWTNYGSDIMMWADTSTQANGSEGSRCDNNGLNASNIIGQANLSGQPWTVYSFGKNSEIIFVLDGSTSTDPVDTDTCAQQESGTLHVLAALQWVSAHRAVTGAPAWTSQFMTQFNTGWEITAGDGGTYNVNSLAYNVTIKK